MEEIKVGEYIRSLVNGEISKVLEVSNLLEEPNIKYYKTGKFTGFCSTEDYNVKHSSNIIDLIEEGDYVNGYEVIDVLENLETGELHLEMPMDYTNEELGDCTIYNKDIKNIVTKEQFNSMKYIVGDESNE